MRHYIFVPPVKTDTVTCMSLYSWLCKSEKNVELIVKKEYSTFFSNLNIPFTSEAEFRKRTNFESELIVYFLHANSFYQYFKDNISFMVANNQIDKILVNFIPEGFGNAMWGESFIDRINVDLVEAEYKDKIKLYQTISYGFKQSYIDNKFPSAEKVVLNYEEVVNAIRENQTLQSIIEKAIRSLKLHKNLLFIPYRPWCTEKFHGGMYNFGTQEHLSEIVLRLVEILDVPEDSLVLFRPDFRYPTESSHLLTKLSKAFETIELSSEIYPDWISLEPLFQGLLDSEIVSVLNIVNLDSTTAIPIMFQSDFSSIDKLNILYGCPLRLLKYVDGGEDFYNRKLKGKIRMFSNHFKPLAFERNKIGLKSDEAGFLEVSIQPK